MATKAATKRLSKEYATMQKEPPPFVWATPDEKNVLTWNYIIRGPPDSPYVGGEYHGVLLFPPEYPFKPPGIKMLTPSGRFQPDKRICFSMSDFHPGTWNPAWSVATILTGLLSFMLSDEMTTGGLSSSTQDKRALASKSHAWNLTQKRFRDAFPDYCTPLARELPNMGEKERGIPDEKQPTTSGTSTTISSSVLVSPANQETLVPTVKDTPNVPDKQIAKNPPNARAGGTFGTFALGWRNLIWEKWRWGAVIAIAVLVSRLSSS